MRKNNNVLTISLKTFIIIACIVLSALCYIKISVFSGICWTITAIIWGMNLENQISHIKKQEYINFLEFTAYSYLCIIKKQQGELNAKQEQINKSKKHKGE